MGGLKELLDRLGIARIAAMAVVAVMLLGFFGFIILRATTPQMAPLYTNLAFDDSTAIVSELNALGVPYELRNEAQTILVAEDQVTSTRMALAENGLPRSGQMGYELFDGQSPLGTTSFMQNVNLVRALEGELARTIGSLNRVASARVHLVLPERELFSRESATPSASIVLSVRGALSSGEIRAIQHLVASAIEGMSPSSVSVVDDSGTLLATGTGEEDMSAMGQAIEERMVAIENRMRTRVEDLLTSIVGAGGARVQVAAELNLDRSTRTSELFDPDGQVVRSTQTVETDDQSNGPGTSGQVTVANELPGASDNAGGGGGTAQSATSLEETVNYEISRTTETSVSEAGGIARLSVAVVVDGVYTTDPNGNATYTPRSEAELAQITALVRSAMGFDEARGDQLEVVNMEFAARPDTSVGTAAPGLFEFGQAELMRLIEAAVTLLIALALVLFVMRPLLRKVLSPEAQPLALPENAAVAPGEADADQLALEQDTARENAQTGNAWMDHARSLGDMQAKTLSAVGEMVTTNPKQATMIVRDWLGEAA